MLSHAEPRDDVLNFDTYQVLQQVDNGTFMYTKHSNLVDEDASGAKVNTIHLESCLEVIQGHAFRDH